MATPKNNRCSDSGQVVLREGVAVPPDFLNRAIPIEVQHDLIALAVLRGQILQAADAYKKLRARIDAKLAAAAEVRS